ncbi:MAG: hypothetical protein ACE367_13890 [Acidimicrobiales bacterium]
MTRMRITAALAAAALLLSLAPPPAAATSSPAPAVAVAADGNATVESGSIVEQPTPRLSPRQIRRALPRPRSFGQGTIRRFVAGDFVTLCGVTQLAGPAPIAAAGARYRNDRTAVLAFMAVEEHRNVRTARQRYNAVRRQITRNCNGYVVGDLRQEPKRTTPVRRIGQQNWVRGYALRNVDDGRIFGETLIHVYRIGRFVVFADVLGGNTLDPAIARRPLQRPFRQLGSSVRGL